MRNLVDTARRSIPSRYSASVPLGGWDIGVATLLIPASITALEGLFHDALGVQIPHWASQFGGTLLGALMAVWFARRFRPQ